MLFQRIDNVLLKTKKQHELIREKKIIKLLKSFCVKLRN